MIKSPNDISILSEAMSRVKKQSTTDGEACFIFSSRVLEAIEAIKKERQQSNSKSESKPEVIDTNPPPEHTDKISRVPSREELFHQILYMDRSRIEPLYHAIEDLVKEVKVISDKLKNVEDKVTSLINESRGTNTNPD